MSFFRFIPARFFFHSFLQASALLTVALERVCLSFVNLMAFVGNEFLGFFVFSAYCCYCLYLVCTCYWLSTFNKLLSEFHVYHFFPISLMPYFFFYLLTSSRVSRVHHRLWRACVRTFQRFLPTARLLARSRPTTVVLSVGNLGPVVSQRLFTSRLKRNT